MAWGILQPSSERHVPGTVLLNEFREINTATQSTDMRTTVHRGKTIILVPQPSDDPNDPLNWPIWVRDGITLLYGYCTILIVGGIGPVLSSLALELSLLFNVSFTKVSLLTGYSLCSTAASGIFVSAAAAKFGKRSPLLVSLAMAVAGTIWGGYATSYNSLLGARIVQGLSVSMFESVIFSIIGDLYCVHERGIRVALMTACIAGLSNLPPVLAGKIAMTLGWRWVFWMLAIFLGIGLGLAFLFGWETAYLRDAFYNTDLASQEALDAVHAKNTQADASHVEVTKHADESVATAPRAVAPRKTFIQLLNPWTGQYTGRPFWLLVLDPFIVLANPAVLWAVLLMSFPVLWNVAINLLVAQIFSAPPYLLNTADLGYISAGPAVGGLIGSISAGLMSDPGIEWLSRKNNGTYEPEFRLLLIIPALITSSIGYFPFGYLIEQGKGPVVMATLWAIGAASMQFVIATVGTYILDAYRSLSVEIFISTMIIKNFLFFGFSYFLNDWLAKWGPAKMFYFVGGLQVGILMTTFIVWMFGKILRDRWHQGTLKKQA